MNSGYSSTLQLYLVHTRRTDDRRRSHAREQDEGSDAGEQDDPEIGCSGEHPILHLSLRTVYTRHVTYMICRHILCTYICMYLRCGGPRGVITTIRPPPPPPIVV